MSTAPTGLRAGVRAGGRTAWRAAATVVVLVVLTALVVVDVVSTGVSPGAWSSAGLSAGVRAVGLLAACGTVGCLVVATLQRNRAEGVLLTGAASRWAIVWLLATVCSVALVAGEVSTEAATSVAGSHGDVDPAEAVRQAVRGGVAAAWAAGTIAVLARGASSGRGVLGCLLLSYGALVPPVLTGHSVHAEEPVTATAAMVVHVLAATTWVGGLLAMVTFAGLIPLPVVARRFSAVALGCVLALAGSGLVNLLAQVDLAALLDLGAFGWLVLVKVFALLLLTAIGALHRRYTLRRLDAGSADAFWLLVCGEVVTMVGVLGVVAVLAQTPR